MQLKLRNFAQYLTVLTFLALCLSPPIALGEIYKWTDAEGNVHFGDKPKDPEQAANAKPVEVKENYQPSARSEEEVEALEDELQVQRERSNQRRLRQQAEQDEALEESRQQKTELCAAYKKDLESLTSIKVVNGRRELTYIEDENGKSISADKQREIVEVLKRRMAEEGCT